MPTWLMTALIIILVLWTLLDIYQWIDLAKKMKRYPFRIYTVTAWGAWQTIITLVVWIVLICYWLR